MKYTLSRTQTHYCSPLHVLKVCIELTSLQVIQFYLYRYKAEVKFKVYHISAFRLRYCSKNNAYV